MNTISKTIWMAGLSLALAAALAHAEEGAEAKKPAGPAYKGRPAVQIPLLADADAPKLEGRLDDAFLKKAAHIDLGLNDGTAKAPAHKTEAWLASTKDTLYVAVRCHEKDIANLIGEKVERDGEIWSHDEVEVFVKIGEEPEAYHQFGVNAAGSYFDGYDQQNTWNSEGIKCAAAKEEKAWTVLIAVPFKDLRQPEKKEELASGWRLNVTRMRPAHKDEPADENGDPVVEESAWSPTMARTSHVPEMFGYAFLEAFGGKLPEAKPAEAKTETKTEAAPAEAKTE